MTTIEARPASPNQQAKQDEIVAGAVKVMLREGLAGCTARAVAVEAGVAKGAIHYYFSDMDVIIDRAMLEATSAYVAMFRPLETGDDPEASFWKALGDYLGPFASNKAIMVLWLDYWSSCTHRGRIEPLERIQAVVTGFFEDLLAALGVEDVGAKAHALTSYVFGTAMQQAVSPVAFDVLRREIASLCEL